MVIIVLQISSPPPDFILSILRKQNTVLNWGGHSCHWIPAILFQDGRNIPQLLSNWCRIPGTNLITIHLTVFLWIANKKVSVRQNVLFIYIDRLLRSGGSPPPHGPLLSGNNRNSWADNGEARRSDQWCGEQLTDSIVTARSPITNATRLFISFPLACSFPLRTVAWRIKQKESYNLKKSRLSSSHQVCLRSKVKLTCYWGTRTRLLDSSNLRTAFITIL